VKPIRTSACNMTFVAPDCGDLPAARGDGFVSTYWQPDAEDLAAIAAGLPIRISWPGSHAMPISVEVEAL
jgi:hypothetical protein